MSFKFFKRNIIVVYIYNKWLSWKTRKVKNFVFVASTGRCGTNSLEKIMGCSNNAICFHEPYPVMTNEDTFYDEKQSKSIFKNLKRIYIKRSSIGMKNYIETNHLFIKNFHEFAVKEFKNKIKIIHLYRDPISCARSYYSLQAIPGKTPLGCKFLINPLDPNNVLYMPSHFAAGMKFDNAIYRCLWYWYEVEARVIKFKDSHPNISVFDIKTSQLNDVHIIKKMFDHIELDYREADLLELVGVKVNKKSDKKSSLIEEDKVFIDANMEVKKAIGKLFQQTFKVDIGV